MKPGETPAAGPLRKRLKSILWLHRTLAPLVRTVRRLSRPGSFSWCITSRQAEERNAFLEEHGKSGLTVFDLGCGQRPALPGAVNVDSILTPAVDVAADLAHLPFRSGSADGVYISGVVEHLRDPVRVVAEIHRVLKKDGRVFADVPFINRCHGAPHDYQRLTQEGLLELFRRFEGCRTGVLAGPASALCDTARHFAALVFSFGNHGLYHFLYHYPFAYLTWPLKFLDHVLDRHPDSAVIAAAFYLVASKGAPSAGSKSQGETVTSL